MTDMIRQRIYLWRWDWTVYAYYSVGVVDSEEILDKLISIECDGVYLQRAYHNLTSGNLDTGLTYSNPRIRTSVVVVGCASSGSETFNSLLHEMRHLEEHIAEACDVEPYGEDVAYLTGDLGKAMYDCVSGLLCDCCRTKARH